MVRRAHSSSISLVSVRTAFRSEGQIDRHLLLRGDQLATIGLDEGNWLKYVLGYMPYDRYAHAVAADMISLVVAVGKHVIVVQPHEPCSFARRQQCVTGPSSLERLRLPDAMSRRPECEDSLPRHRSEPLPAVALIPFWSGRVLRYSVADHFNAAFHCVSHTFRGLGATS